MNIVIIEDEPQTAAVLKEIIEEAYPTAKVIAVLESIVQSVSFLSDNKDPELIFMDIQLADGLCFEIFSRVSISCPVIFCTAYDQFTLQAFKSNGIDYILKPVKEEDIKAAFAKIEQLRNTFSPAPALTSSVNELFKKKNYKNTILIRFRESFIPVPVERIAFFLLENEVVYAYRFDQQKHAVFKTLDEIESSLNPELFYRINRQALINRQAVQEIQPYFNRKVVIKTPVKMEEKLVVSRLKVTSFMQWLEAPES